MPSCQFCGHPMKPADTACPQCKAPVQGQDPSAIGKTGEAAPAAQLEYRSVGIRFAALLIDGILLFTCFIVTGRIFAGMVGGVTESGFELHGMPALMLQLLNMVIALGYTVLMEGKVNGQTLGKMATGIRVVREDGSPIGIPEAFVRNILRVVDALPYCIPYLLGAILVWNSPLKQRLGDKVAHTVVVKK